jgi:membrane-associated phospholipid phosphatase
MKKQPIYSFFYLLGILINILFNYLLKYIFLIPKPFIDIHLFHLKIIQNNYSWEELGMPSLFSTLLFYSFVYFYLIYPSSWINILFLFFIICGLYFFYKIKQHSFLQIFLGSIIGILFSFLFIFFSKYFLKGELKENKQHELILI